VSIPFNVTAMQCILLSLYDLLQGDRHVGQNTLRDGRNRSTKKKIISKKIFKLLG
jgi:hypothetical protein